MSFLNYYRKLTTLNRVLGVEFAFRHPFDGGRKHIRKFISLTYTAFIFAIWLGICLSALYRVVDHDIVSQICNWLQLLSVCSMSTIVVVWCAMKKTFYADDILKCLSDIDRMFLSAELPLNYPQEILRYGKWNTGLLVYLVLLFGFDYYVWIWRNVHNMSLSYWLIFLFPLIFNVLVVSQTILIVSLVSDRFAIIRRALKRFRFESLRVKQMLENPLMAAITVQLKEQRDSMDLMNRILQILNQLVGLCGKVNEYFSIVFLTAIVSFFVVTLIQTYYAFLILFNMSAAAHRTLLEIITCLDMAILQLALLVMLGSVGQGIRVEAEKIMRIFNSYHATQDLVGGGEIYCV